mmetsp:Transcript_49840/g.113497  ORF Transcript_49840/g.113497 Transcript_49840/m.113497 type:complete len:218 (+) Transcript_49840:400-1053(+)
MPSPVTSFAEPPPPDDIRCRCSDLRDMVVSHAAPPLCSVVAPAASEAPVGCAWSSTSTDTVCPVARARRVASLIFENGTVTPVGISTAPSGICPPGGTATTCPPLPAACRACVGRSGARSACVNQVLDSFARVVVHPPPRAWHGTKMLRPSSLHPRRHFSLPDRASEWNPALVAALHTTPPPERHRGGGDSAGIRGRRGNHGGEGDEARQHDEGPSC